MFPIQSTIQYSQLRVLIIADCDGIEPSWNKVSNARSFGNSLAVTTATALLSQNYAPSTSLNQSLACYVTLKGIKYFAICSIPTTILPEPFNLVNPTSQ